MWIYTHLESWTCNIYFPGNAHTGLTNLPLSIKPSLSPPTWIFTLIKPSLPYLFAPKNRNYWLLFCFIIVHVFSVRSQYLPLVKLVHGEAHLLIHPCPIFILSSIILLLLFLILPFLLPPLVSNTFNLPSWPWGVWWSIRCGHQRLYQPAPESEIPGLEEQWHEDEQFRRDMTTLLAKAEEPNTVSVDVLLWPHWNLHIHLYWFKSIPLRMVSLPFCALLDIACTCISVDIELSRSCSRMSQRPCPSSSSPSLLWEVHGSRYAWPTMAQ